MHLLFGLGLGTLWAVYFCFHTSSQRNKTHAFMHRIERCDTNFFENEKKKSSQRSLKCHQNTQAIVFVSPIHYAISEQSGQSLGNRFVDLQRKISHRFAAALLSIHLRPIEILFFGRFIISIFSLSNQTGSIRINTNRRMSQSKAMVYLLIAIAAAAASVNAQVSSTLRAYGGASLIVCCGSAFQSMTDSGDRDLWFRRWCGLLVSRCTERPPQHTTDLI